jgi:hypothetical protein
MLPRILLVGNKDNSQVLKPKSLGSLGQEVEGAKDLRDRYARAPEDEGPAA